MSIISSLIELIKKDDPKVAPEGICPNCWGRQEYGGKFYEALKQQTFDVTKIEDSTRGWIEDYVDKNLSEIKLHQNGDEQICNKCRVSYKEV